LMTFVLKRTVAKVLSIGSWCAGEPDARPDTGRTLGAPVD
jgi:hypothetical protein